MNPLNNNILPTISGFLLDDIYRIPTKENAVKRNDFISFNLKFEYIILIENVYGL
ncbi:hypothetical protein [Lactococcus lactis]|uniref:hypothetical protein n=1 Tax=Lactococcus lactis TaxID=1358 RepID=UPI0013747873|nr:hypothetical protein [Lactococcus lactis]